MGRQRRKKKLNAAVAIYLSLNIQVQDDYSPDWLLTIPLLPLNFWLEWGWQAQLITRQMFSWWRYCDQGAITYSQRWGIAITLLGIGCKASLYGLGIRL